MAFLFLPALLILIGTSMAINRKDNATVEWALRTALLGALAIAGYVLVAVSIFMLVVAVT